MNVRNVSVRFHGAWVMKLLLATLVATTALTLAVAPAEAKTHQGSLVLTPQGIPKGTTANFTLKGIDRKTRRIKRTFRKATAARLSKLPVGGYRIKVLEVATPQAVSVIRAGARVLPVKPTLKVRVKRGKTGRVAIRYGTIVNPGLESVSPGAIKTVTGDPLNPTSIHLSSSSLPQIGDVLSSPPSGQLPQGLLARVTSAAEDNGSAVVGLEPASIYEVVPNMTLDHSLQTASPEATPAALGAKVSCGEGVSPYRRIENLRIIGGWNTVSVLGVNVKVGLRAELDFDVSAGVKFASTLGVNCKVAVSVPFQGMAGPVPVYGAIEGSLEAGIGARGTVDAGGSVHIRTGLATVGVPPSLTAIPLVDFDSPKLSVTGSLTVEATAGIGLAAEIGIGAAGVANIHARIDNTLKFTGRTGSCSWDLELGGFSAGGRLAGWDISSPSTPPLYKKQLWKGCSQEAGGKIFADTSPGTAKPPAKLGSFSMKKFGRDTISTLNYFINGMNGPTGRLSFPNVLAHLTTLNDETTNFDWRYGSRWSHGYAGDVYIQPEGKDAIVDLPAGTRAFYLYGEPGDSADLTVRATSSDGKNSIEKTFSNVSSARYFGFFTAAGNSLRRITVSSSDPTIAIGEFGIAG